MKNFMFFLLAALFMSGSVITVSASTGSADPSGQVKKATPTEVYYFHMTRRCVTCQAVETVTQDALNEYFSEALKNGDLIFKSINLEDKENKNLVKKMKVSGQSLLIINGNDRADITDKGFLYAKNEPGKLKEIVKTSIGKYIK